MTPSALLFGRELRLPAQIGEANSTVAPSAQLQQIENETEMNPLEAYALRVHYNLLYAWHAARNATSEAQALAISDTTRHTHQQTYKEGDRVCRLLYDQANKLQYAYAGPYRIHAVLQNGRYQLTDLENNMIFDEFDSHNLRPYRTWVDEEELQPDEYLVDRILGHRDSRGTREYKIKWRQYPKSAATWEPKSEIMRRCAETVTQYETELSTQRQEKEKKSKAATKKRENSQSTDKGFAPDPTLLGKVNYGTHPATIGQDDENISGNTEDRYLSDDEPVEACFKRGTWHYARYVATQRGRQLRQFSASSYTPEERESELFAKLREEFLARSAPRERITIAAIIRRPLRV